MANRRHSMKNRLMGVENFEDRLLMAGNVTASIRGGTLFVDGDDSSNSIAIYRGANAGQIVVQGFDLDGGTTINGGTANQTVTLEGFNNGVVVKMNKGDDRVSLTNLAVPGGVDLNGGQGHDTIHVGLDPNNLAPSLWPGLTVGAVTIGETITVRGDSGNDTVYLSGLNVAKNENIDLGDGDDTFIKPVGNLDQIGGSLTINFGRGNDRAEGLADFQVSQSFAAIHSSSGTLFIEVSDAQVDGNVNIQTGRGADTITLDDIRTPAMTVRSFEGNDVVTLRHSTSRIANVRVETGAGHDTLNLEGLIAGSLRASTQAGDDRLNVSNAQITDAFFSTDVGREIGSIVGSNFGILTVNLGGNSDRLTVSNTTASTRADFDGGTGDDRLIDGGGNNFASSRRRSF